jgi:hypothetical protein
VIPVTLDDQPAAGSAAASAPPRASCRGVFVWQTSTGREVCACTRSGGHAGDHRDAAGYAWNDERWLD